VVAESIGLTRIYVWQLLLTAVSIAWTSNGTVPSFKVRGNPRVKLEVDALGVMTISHGCFERCGSNKKTPP